MSEQGKKINEFKVGDVVGVFNEKVGTSFLFCITDVGINMNNTPVGYCGYILLAEWNDCKIQEKPSVQNMDSEFLSFSDERVFYDAQDWIEIKIKKLEEQRTTLAKASEHVYAIQNARQTTNN